MLKLARTVIDHLKRLFVALSSVGQIAHWDLSEIAGEIRALVLEAEELGREELATRLSRIEDDLRANASIILAEKAYMQGVLLSLEDKLIEGGLPLDRANEIALALDHTSYLWSLLHDPALVSQAEESIEVGRRYDETLESLRALQEVIDAQGNPPSVVVYDQEDETEQDGIEVISLEEFIHELNGGEPVENPMFLGFPEGLGFDDPEFDFDEEELDSDLALAIRDRFLTLDRALDELDELIPIDVTDEVADALSDAYKTFDRLSEVTLGVGQTAH